MLPTVREFLEFFGVRSSQHEFMDWLVIAFDYPRSSSSRQSVYLFVRDKIRECFPHAEGYDWVELKIFGATGGYFFLAVRPDSWAEVFGEHVVLAYHLYGLFPKQLQKVPDRLPIAFAQQN